LPRTVRLETTIATDTVSRPALLWRSISYYASIVSANVAIPAPNLPGGAGQKEKAMRGAGPCMSLKSLARPDRRMISPPAAPVAYSVVCPDLCEHCSGRQISAGILLANRPLLWQNTIGKVGPAWLRRRDSGRSCAEHRFSTYFRDATQGMAVPRENQRTPLGRDAHSVCPLGVAGMQRRSARAQDHISIQ
jgi:hypothetical protein